MIFLLTSLLTAALGILMYPTKVGPTLLPDMGFLAWFYLVPLFSYLLSKEHSLKKIFFISLFASTLQYLGCVYWLILAMKNFGGLDYVSAGGVLSLIVLMMAGYFTLATTLSFFIHRRLKLPLYLVFPFAMVVAEYSRCHWPFGGFTWASPAYSQGHYLSIFQWVDVTGVAGLHLLIFLVNTLLSEVGFILFKSHKKEKMVTPVVLVVLLIFVSFTGSILRKSYLDDDKSKVGGRQVALIQGNINQDMKWDPALASDNLKQYALLTDESSQKGAELAFWPETAYPFAIDLQNMSEQRLVDRASLPVPVLTGAVSVDRGNPDSETLYNSAFLVGTDSLIGSLNLLDGHFYYHKRHLVPFGEYIPLKNWLTFAKRLTVAVGDFSPGDNPSLIFWKDFKMGMLICYEDIFSDESREVVNAGANVLVNLTNDAWYGDTSAPHQHVVFSQMRALENRRYVVRATNTGLTAVIDAHGRILSSLPVFTQGTLDEIIYPSEILTPYTIYGSVVSVLSLAGVLVYFILALIKSPY